MYEATTHDITVTVEPVFLDKQSDPDQGQYIWSYHITIENNGPKTVQLVSRHWNITNARGDVQEVIGEGVVGQQPVLRPGQCFDYSSGCPLTTPSGIMMGTFSMRHTNGDLFDITIPPFSLDSPYQPTHLN